MNNCHYCDKETTKYVSIDIDLPNIPICDNEECKIKLYLKLNWTI